MYEMYIYFLNIVISKVEVIHIDFIAIPAKETNLVIPLCGILKCGIFQVRIRSSEACYEF